jgi:hypothetical protein
MRIMTSTWMYLWRRFIKERLFEERQVRPDLATLISTYGSKHAVVRVPVEFIYLKNLYSIWARGVDMYLPR